MGSQNIPFYVRLLAIAVAILLIPARPADAQSPCGNEVTVVYGDTLAEIAARCNTTVAALLRANPDVDDPNVIHVGQELTIPSGADPDERGATPGETGADIDIQPQAGPTGLSIRLTGTGLPPSSQVQIGFGPVDSEYEIIDRAQTNARGALNTSTEVPSWANPDQEYVFVVTREGARWEVISEEFQVVERRPADEPTPANGSSGGEPGGGTEVTGMLTSEGVECQAMRGVDGTLYTLTGDLAGFSAGDCVRVRGTVAEASICMQGTTINVEAINRR